jgi:hypothetical protein
MVGEAWLERAFAPERVMRSEPNVPIWQRRIRPFAEQFLSNQDSLARSALLIGSASNDQINVPRPSSQSPRRSLREAYLAEKRGMRSASGGLFDALAKAAQG